MTIESGWENAPEDQEQGPDTWGNTEPIPVIIHGSMSERVAPEAVSLLTLQIPVAINVAGTGTGQPAQLCPHAYHRYKAKFTWTVPANCTIYVAKTREALMSGSLANAFSIVVGATAVTQSTLLMPEYDGQPALYAVASIAGAQVSVMDETYKTVQ